MNRTNTKNMYLNYLNVVDAMDHSSCKSGRIPSAFQWRLRCVPARHVENSPQPVIVSSGPGINGLIESGDPSKVATPMTKRKTISCIRCFTCSSPFRSCDKSIRIGRLYFHRRTQITRQCWRSHHVKSTHRMKKEERMKKERMKKE